MDVDPHIPPHAEVLQMRWSAGAHDGAVVIFKLGAEYLGEHLPDALCVDVMGLDGAHLQGFRISEGDLPVAIDAKYSVGNVEEEPRVLFVPRIFLTAGEVPPLRRDTAGDMRIRHTRSHVHDHLYRRNKGSPGGQSNFSFQLSDAGFKRNNTFGQAREVGLQLCDPVRMRSR